ncbi:MAG TPA: ABC transporter ATP-binding protein [Bacteroidales bacterium]|nr:ABC transporter ATP-binding protein [Bacteroidales bacterium]
MIKTVNLTKIFRTELIETTALLNVNFEVRPGEFVAIMGPSGCGKSTLLNILGLLDKPDKGEYYFNGTGIAGMNERQLTNLRKGNIGFVFQSFNLIDELTVFENIELPLIALNHSRSRRRKTVDEILEKMQIGHRRDHFPRQLSGGQQQRVAVSRALITRPALILADEPTGNLDSQNGEQVMALLEQLNMEGTTVVMVTHSISHAERAHRIVNLFDGHIIAERLDRSFEPQTHFNN